MKKLTIGGIFFLLAAVLALYFSMNYNSGGELLDLLIEDVPPLLFIMLMLVLPVLGVSIGVFLVFVGMKFGTVTGIVLTGILMLIHMAVSHFLVHSFMRCRIVDYLAARGKAIPSLDRQGGRRIAFLFALLPGLPYAAKNYLLALSDISFRDYMVINWIAQFGLSVPFVVLGQAVVRKNTPLLAGVLCLLVGGYLLLNSLRKRYHKGEKIS